MIFLVPRIIQILERDLKSATMPHALESASSAVASRSLL
jgi:hypothetical protein